MRKLAVVGLFLFLSFFPSVSLHAEVTYMVEEGTLTGLAGAGEVCVPDNVTSIDLALIGENIPSFTCNHELESVNLSMTDCEVETVSLAAIEVSVSINGSSEIEDVVIGSNFEYSTVNLTIDTVTVSAITLDSEDVIASLDCRRVKKMSFGNTVNYAVIEANGLDIDTFQIGKSVESLQMIKVNSIESIKNRSSSFSVEDDLIYALDDYNDIDCLGSGIAASDYALVFYPMNRKNLTGLSTKCDMLGDRVLEGHEFNGDLKIPKGIRIAGYRCFSDLPNKTTITFPLSMQFLDDEVAADSTVDFVFNKKGVISASPNSFNGAMIDKVGLPDDFQFIYYTCTDEQLASKVMKAATSIGSFKTSHSSKTANVLKLSGLQVEWTDEVTDTTKQVVGVVIKKIGMDRLKITWDAVESAGHYDIKYSTSKNFKTAIITTRLTNSCILPGLKQGKTYYVKVRAANGSSTGKWSKKTKKKV